MLYFEVNHDWIISEHIRETLRELEILVGKEEWKEVKGAAIKLRYLRGIERAIINWLAVH